MLCVATLALTLGYTGAAKADWYSAQTTGMSAAPNNPPGTCQDTADAQIMWENLSGAAVLLGATPNDIINGVGVFGISVAVNKINDSSGKLSEVILSLSGDPNWTGDVKMYTSMAACEADNPPPPPPPPNDPALN